MPRPKTDHSLDTLLQMVGVFVSPDGWWVKTEAKPVAPSSERPHGVKYSLTLHDANGKRVIGYDNSHGFSSHRKTEWDHKHIREKVKPYNYVSAAKLMEDFYADVDRWLKNE